MASTGKRSGPLHEGHEKEGKTEKKKKKFTVEQEWIDMWLPGFPHAGKITPSSGSEMKEDVLALCGMPTDAQHTALVSIAPTWVNKKGMGAFVPNRSDPKWILLTKRVIQSTARTSSTKTKSVWGIEGDAGSALLARLHGTAPNGLTVLVDCSSWKGAEELSDAKAYNALPCFLRGVTLSKNEEAYYQLLMAQFQASLYETMFLLVQILRTFGLGKIELHAQVIQLTKSKSKPNSTSSSKSTCPGVEAILFDPADGPEQHAQWKRQGARFWKSDLFVALKKLLGLSFLKLAKDIAPQNEGEYCFGAAFMFVHMATVGLSVAKRNKVWAAILKQPRLVEVYESRLIYYYRFQMEQAWRSTEGAFFVLSKAGEVFAKPRTHSKKKKTPKK